MKESGGMCSVIVESARLLSTIKTPPQEQFVCHADVFPTQVCGKRETLGLAQPVFEQLAYECGAHRATRLTVYIRDDAQLPLRAEERGAVRHGRFWGAVVQ